MTLVKVRSRGINLADDFAFTGSISGAGKILTVSETICATGQDYTGTSYQNVFSASITPSASSNKVLLIARLNYQLYSSSEDFLSAVYAIRDNSESEITVSDAVKKGGSDGREHSSNTTLMNLHSPNTTSSYTYYVSQKCVGSNRRCSIYGNNAAYGTKPSSLILIEMSA